MNEHLKSLLEKRQALDTAIAALQAKARAEAIQRVKAAMDEVGLTMADFRGRPPTNPKVRFANASGQTWGGIGPRPKWLRLALANGATMDELRCSE